MTVAGKQIRLETQGAFRARTTAAGNADVISDVGSISLGSNGSFRLTGQGQGGESMVSISSRDAFVAASDTFHLRF
eukprot:SAG31_NODE_914_length_11058_cov_13.316270_2_plen_76_part_00